MVRRSQVAYKSVSFLSAVTDYHKLGGLNQYKCVCAVLEVRRLKWVGQVGCFPFWRLWEDLFPCLVQLPETAASLGLWTRMMLTSAFLDTYPFLTLTLLPPSYKEPYVTLGPPK